jgi:prepilin peptidase CpaA
MHYVDASIQLILFALLIISAYTDITAGKVYNWCTFPALSLGLILNYLYGGLPGLWSSFLGMACATGLFAVFCYYRVMGVGDLKLLAAVGALKGLQFILLAIFYTSLVGAILAILYLVWRGRLFEGVARSLQMGMTFKRKEMTEEQLQKTSAARERIPYGVAISIGTMWAFFLSQQPR